MALCHSFLWMSNIPFTHWKRPWCWERLRAKGEGGSRGWDGWIHHWLNGHEIEQTLGDGEGQWSLVCCSPWSQRVRHNWAIEQVFHCVHASVCVPHIFFIHASISGHVGSMFLYLINSAAMNTEVYVSFRIWVFVFYRYMPRIEPTGLYGNSNFSFFKSHRYCSPQLLQQFTLPPTV